MPLEILFSYTVLVGVLYLVAVAIASYLGATIAIRRHFDGRREFS